jgi:hypothetical protein
VIKSIIVGKERLFVDKKKITLWGIMLLIGLMLTGCAAYDAGYYDYPYYYYGYDYGYPYYYNHEGGEHHHDRDYDSHH